MVLVLVIAFFRTEAQILDSGIKMEGQNDTRVFGRPFVFVPG